MKIIEIPAHHNLDTEPEKVIHWYGGIWDYSDVQLYINAKVDCKGLNCKHLHSHFIARNYRYDKSYFDEQYAICPRVLVACNEGGYNNTGICLDCILEQANIGVEMGTKTFKMVRGEKEEKSDLFPVENYGDMLAKVLESNLVYFKEYGSYQGEYLAVLERNGVFELYFDYYGSCSGCDWLEAEQEYNYKTGKNEISYKLALEYCNQLSNKLIIPVSMCKHINHKAQKELSKFIEEKIGNFEEKDKGELFEILGKYNLKKGKSWEK